MILSFIKNKIMSNDNYYISKNTLVMMYNHMFYGNSEFCSYLDYTNGSLIIKQSTLTTGGLESYGDNKTRGMCQYVGNPTQFIYHSHPTKSRSYISAEDILKVLKHPKKYILSVVSTRWGVYIIKQTSESINQKIKELNIEKYKKTISNSLSTIGFMENDKGYKSGVYSHELKENELNTINHVLREIELKTNLDINFYRWDNDFTPIYV